jgi:centromeric protein E
VKRVALSSLEGINGTVFVYGQTGSGKTYTILGKERLQKNFRKSEEHGVLIYALKDLFEKIEEDSSRTFFLKCAYIEIYNEQVYDLLRREEG